MKTIKLISVILLFSLVARGQNPDNCQAFWKLTSITGEMKMTGFYKQQEIKRRDLTDTAQAWMLSAGIILNTKSYFCHPNFLTLDVGIEYSPFIYSIHHSDPNASRLVSIPDEGETTTLSKFDARATLFQKKIITLTSFVNLSQTYSNREGLSDIRTDYQNYGGVLFFKSPLLPVTLSYTQGKMIQDEIQTGRLYKYENKDLEARIYKSFSRYDKNELVLSHNEYKRTERELPPIKNIIDEFTLNNDLYFDRRERTHFHSMINGADQKGYDSLKRFQAFETLRFKLPLHFELIGNYNYYNIERRTQKIVQNTYKGMLRHKLYESLYSDVFCEYTDSKQTGFEQKDTRTGFDLDYLKNIPFGTLNLAYKYLWQHQEKIGEASALQTLHEQYVLTDGTIILLKRPYVNISSIMVWDATGTTLYQLGPDYLLQTIGNYIQIQRVPGGLIANNSTVFIDYIANIPGSYKLDMQNEYWSAGVTLFNKLIGVYYRHTKQNYFNLQTAEALTLNYYTQQVYGIRSEYKAFSGGIEIDDNNSTILPYLLHRYYLTIQGQYKQKWLYSVNGNISDYHLIHENVNQLYADISGQLTYYLTSRSKLNFEAGYRQQVGTGIDLELLNARLEYTFTNQRNYFTIGVQTYKRNYMEEIDNYRGVYFRISRRF